MTLLAPALAVLLAVSPDLGAPGASSSAPPTEVLRTDRFSIVHTEKARGAAHFLAGRIEAIRDEVTRAVGRDWAGGTEVRLGLGRAEYEALALPEGRPPPWAVALAYPARNTVLLDAHSLTQADGQQTLRHELVHVALGQLGSGWPHWFQEGLAMELTGERRFRWSQFATLAEAVALERVYAFDELAQSFPSRPGDVEVAYAQSVAFVQFLRQRHGVEAFGQLIDRVRAGDPFETAFGVAFHASSGLEERAFREELRHRYPWWPLWLATGSLVWLLTTVLLVVAAVQRQRVVARHRLEQARVERLEDLGQGLVDAGVHPANDDAEPGAAVGAAVGMPDALWVIHSLRQRPRPAPEPIRAPRSPGT